MGLAALVASVPLGQTFLASHGSSRSNSSIDLIVGRSPSRDGRHSPSGESGAITLRASFPCASLRRVRPEIRIGCHREIKLYAVNLDELTIQQCRNVNIEKRHVVALAQ